MNSRRTSHDAQSLKVRHFLLQAKALADLRRRPGAPSAVTDAELRDLLESVWIAERARAEPKTDLPSIARAYRPSKWAGMEVSAEAMERTLSRATDFYETLEVHGEALLI